MDQLSTQGDQSNIVLPNVNKSHISKISLIIIVCFSIVTIAGISFILLWNKSESKPEQRSNTFGTSSDIYKDISVGIRNTMK